MNLHVTRWSILNSLLRDDYGHPIYRVETRKTGKPGGQESIITRFEPGTKSDTASKTTLVVGPQSLVPATSQTQDETDVLLGGFTEREIGRIEWHYTSPTLITQSGKTVDVESYMPWQDRWNRRRAFTASNGQSYVWKYGSMRSSLTRNDHTNTPVAKNHPDAVRLFGKSQRQWIEISSDELNIMDEIIMTFVYLFACINVTLGFEVVWPTVDGLQGLGGSRPVELWKDGIGGGLQGWASCRSCKTSRVPQLVANGILYQSIQIIAFRILKTATSSQGCDSRSQPRIVSETPSLLVCQDVQPTDDSRNRSVMLQAGMDQI
ncbi:hypothetical protein EVG20_g8867 [Dentipellis fragilis]|uniref:DUF6593 domain-containing protein n=1 Tax=Dentipellis fragilis TaxID=205917 RepID=A0A4Y9Y5A3_9AGAM|nr:hypothetical protein EVG20_g8867 [Dentipellis fragilis]